MATRVLCVMFIAIPLAILPESNFPGYYPKLLWLHAGLAGLALSKSHDLVRTPILLPAAAFLAASLISIPNAINTPASIVVLTHRSALLAILIVVPALISRREISDVISAIGIVSGLTALIGIGQYAGWFGLNIPSSGMPSATFGYRNFGAAFTIVALPFVILKLANNATTRARLFWTSIFFLNSMYLLVTRTRAAWGACILSLLVVAAILRWRQSLKSPPKFSDRRSLGTLLAGSVALSFLFAAIVPSGMAGTGYDRHSVEKTTLTGTISSTFEPGADKNRLTMWRHTLEMVETAPLTGLGLGNWEYVYPNFDRGDVSWKGATPRRPHNDYLWVLAETGTLGLLALLWLMLAAGKTGIRALRTSNSTRQLQVLAAIGSLLAVSLHSLFSFPLERIPTTLVAAFALVILAYPDDKPKTGIPHAYRKWIWLLLGMVQALSGALAWRGIDFDRHAFRQSQAVASGNWLEGIREGTEALRAGPFDPQVLLVKGLSHHMVGQYDQAILDQKECLTYHPYLVNAINNLGLSLNANGKPEEAIQQLEQIRSLDPDHIEMHLNLARANESLGRTSVAIEELKQAHTKASERIDILTEIARLQEQAKSYVAAEATIREALKIEPEAFALHYRLGVLKQNQGNLDAAAAQFARVISLNREYLPVYYNLGELSVARGDTALAIRAYKTFIAGWRGPTEALTVVKERLQELE